MLLRTVLLASATASLGVAAPAVACDQHGPGQIGGFHRYNPFANAFNNVQTRGETVAKSEATVRREESEKRKAENKKRAEALDEEAEAEKKAKADLRSNNQQGRGALK